MRWMWGCGQEAEAARGLGLAWRGNARTVAWTAEHEESEFGGSLHAPYRRVLPSEFTAQRPRQLLPLGARIFPS